MSGAVPATSIAFRCDGDERSGAGHVGRCLPLAVALARLGCAVSFVGVYEGLAGWLLARAGVDVRAPDPGSPCGVAPERWGAAVVDSYRIAPAEICALAAELPLLTLAEANRCPTRGILLDYHLDTAERTSARLLAGPSFAPLCPAFAGAGRAGADVRTVLVSAGGSSLARELLDAAVPAVSTVFPQADILVAGGSELRLQATSPRVIALPSPSALIDVVARVDLAVTAAGLTAYELACAGIPQLAIAIAPNQRRVVRALLGAGLAPCLDLLGSDSLADLPHALEALRQPGPRRRLSERGRSLLDGGGAGRAASAFVARIGAFT